MSISCRSTILSTGLTNETCFENEGTVDSASPVEKVGQRQTNGLTKPQNSFVARVPGRRNNSRPPALVSARILQPRQPLNGLTQARARNYPHSNSRERRHDDCKL
ncbi:unnamed protein product [Protopolystoma xenopodis]|uniref:Uncharacterized protein n=1 Tax=Protopolystoma xenopodis TaxID=117903 RepID=A0A3S5FG87_9PLAT|nr:unnamed protein product [Protopolystoma xenopodis]